MGGMAKGRRGSRKRASKADAREIFALVQALRTRTSMFVYNSSLLEVIAYLDASSRTDLLSDEFREWLAHKNRLPCEYAWPALALQLLSDTRTDYRIVPWDRDLTLTVQELRPKEVLLRLIGRSKKAQHAAITRVCGWIEEFLTWRSRLNPRMLTRFRLRFTKH